MTHPKQRQHTPPRRSLSGSALSAAPLDTFKVVGNKQQALAPCCLDGASATSAPEPPSEGVPPRRTTPSDTMPAELADAAAAAADPGAVWRNGAFAGEFGDAFIAETDLEGGHSGPAITQLIVVVRAVLKERLGECSLLDEADAAAALAVADGLAGAAAIEEEKGDAKAFENFAAFLGSFRSKLRALQPGERMPFCGGWMSKGGGHALMFVAERQENGCFALAICNTGQGVNYHPKIQGDYPKTKHRCAIRIKDIPYEQFLDEGVWYLFHKIMVFPEKEHGPEMMYEVILPHLCETINIPRIDMSCDEVEQWASGQGFPKDILKIIRQKQLGGKALLEADQTELAWRAHSAACSLKHWTCADVGAWLTSELELPQYAELFTSLEVDGASVASLDAEGLEGFGVDPVDHRKILDAIAVQGKRKASDADRSGAALEVLMNKHLQNKAGDLVNAQSVLEGKLVGLYFSASWCGPCKAFTPKLIEAYNEIKKDHPNFEIVFVSADKDEAQFKEYFAKMPWLALPFGDRDGKQLLEDILVVRGIPKLILVDTIQRDQTGSWHGDLISMDGVRLVSGVCKFPWKLSSCVSDLMTKLEDLRGETYTSASLAAAVERCDVDDTNGDFETIQRSGTCYFRCVLTCYKYLLKNDGMSKKKRKQLFFLFRVGFLDAIEADLKVEKKVSGFQDSDRRMIDMACSQTALSAVKEHKLGSLDLEGLRAVQAQVVRIKAAAAAVDIAGADTGAMWLDMSATSTATVVPYHGFELVAAVGGTLVECTLPGSAAKLGLELTGDSGSNMQIAEITPGSAAAADETGLKKGMKLKGVGGKSVEGMPADEVHALLDVEGGAETQQVFHFEDAFSTEAETFKGGLTEANPPLFVDLLEPSTQITTFAAAAAHINKCRKSCDEIRKKTCARSVVLNQVCALVENTFADVLPLPLPNGSADSASCVWSRTTAVTHAEQQQCLENLRNIALIYGASSLSNVYDRSTDSLRAVVMASILAMFDACVRMQASDGASIISKLLCGLDDSGTPEAEPFWLNTKSFDKKTFASLSERMVLYSPAALAARRSIVMYFEQSEEAGSQQVLFDWEWEKANEGGMQMFGGGDSSNDPTYKVMEDDITFGFVRKAIDRLGVQSLPNRSGARYGNGATGSSWEVSSDVEKAARWFCDENWEVAPEFNWYRDIHFLYQLALDDSELLFRANRNWPKLWSTSHGGCLPLYQFKGTDRDQKVAAIRCTVGDWRTGTKVSVDTGRRRSPAEVGVYATLEKPSSSRRQKPGLDIDRLRQGLTQMLGQTGMPPDQLESEIEQLIEAIEEGNAPPQVMMMVQMIMGGAVGMGGGGGGGGGGMGMPGMGGPMGGGAPPAAAVDGLTEEDVLFLDNIPTWSNAVSDEESERMLSFLTAPYIAAPLLLSFFSDGRVGVLINTEIQALLESVLFEPLAFAPEHTGAAVVPVPADQRDSCLGTGYGILMNEVVYTPDAVLTPLIKVCTDAADLCIGDYDSKFVPLLLFVVRMAVRIESFFNHAKATMEAEYRASSQTETLLQQLRKFLSQTAASLVTNWLRQAQAADDIKAATNTCTHLALIYGSVASGEFAHETAQAFMSAVSFVVSWHSKEPGNETGDPKNKKKRKGRGRRREEPDPADDLPKLLAVPVHDVFKAMEHQRASIIKWSESVEDPLQRDAVLNKVVGAALQGEAPDEMSLDEGPSLARQDSMAMRGWRQVSEAPLDCQFTIESEHPYLPSTDTYWTVSFPGAEYISLNFDSQCKTEESEGEPHDYVTIFKDASCTDHWGPAKRMGGTDPDCWPGANGPGFTIPGDTVVVHFHSDATKEEWGFKLTMVAPVCMPSVLTLLGTADCMKASQAPTEVKTFMCQRALVACRNDMGQDMRAMPPRADGVAMPAAQYLAVHATELQTDAEAVILEAAQAAAAEAEGSVGLFTDPMGNIEVNMQTGEVYLRKRMLMPTPREITSHTDFESVFAGVAPFCAVTSANENRHWITIIHGEHSYEVMAWTPFQFDEAGSSKPGEDASLLLGGLPDKKCHSMPRRVSKPGEATGLRFSGSTFKPYSKGDGVAGWASEYLDPLLDDAVRTLNMDETPMLWVSAEPEDSSLLTQFIMYAPPTGSLEERKGHPGQFFDIHALRSRKVLHVYALVEESRRMQRQLVYTTDCKLTLKHLQVNSSKRDNPWVEGTRNAAGNMFDTLLTTDGDLIPRSGAGQSALGSVGSLWIKRNRVLADADDDDAATEVTPTEMEWSHEVFLPRRVLSGLVPDALLEEYQFWKTGPLTLRGYPKDEENEHSITVRLCTGTGKGVNSYTAVIRRTKKGSTKTVKAKKGAKGTEGKSTILLNLLRAEPGTPLHSIAATMSRLDNLSHVLAWSNSDAYLGEEVDITMIELPRLKMRFQVRNSGGIVRLHSLDYDGVHICDQPDASVLRLAKDIPHAVVLESVGGQKSMLVPNYALERVVIRSCPLNTELVLKASKFDDLEEFWAKDQWATSVQTRFYIYPIHLSNTFLQTTSTSSAFYLVLLRLMKRDYEGASRVMSSCFTDTAFSKEEKWIMKLVKKTAEDDQHPDAHACRLRLALVCYECGEDVPWNVEDDMSGYTLKYGHVATACRLTVEDEHLLLQHHSDPTRSKYLEAVEEASKRETVAFSLSAFCAKNNFTDFETAFSDKGVTEVKGLVDVADDALTEIGLDKTQLTLLRRQVPIDGACPVEVPFSGAPCEVGGTNIQVLYGHLGVRLTQKMASTAAIPGAPIEMIDHMQIKYERPHSSSLRGAGAVEVIRDFEKDDFSGRKKGKGLCLLYEMLIGRLNVSITGQDDEMPLIEPEYDGSTMGQPISEPEESIGCPRRIPSNAVMVKLMIGAMLVKETNKFEEKGLKPMVAAGVALLLPAVHAATTGEPVMEKYPSLPVANMKTKLQDGCKAEQGSQLDTFFRILLKRNNDWVDGPQFRQCVTPMPGAKSYPSELTIPAGFTLNSRPVATGCGCDRRLLSSLSLDGNLDLTDEEVAAFSDVPLRGLGLSLENHIKTVPKAALSLESLPFDLSKLPVAQSDVAISMMDRMNDDLKSSFNAAKDGTNTRLLYLDDTHIEALMRDLAKEDEDEDATPSPRDDLLSTFSVNTAGLARTVSARGSSMLRIALQHLVGLHDKLLGVRVSESEKITAHIQAAETLGNDTTHGNQSEDSRVAFELQRFAGQRISLWFELIAAAPLSTTSVEDLLALNKCLAEENIDKLLKAVCGVLLRSVRLSQLNQCIGSVDKLMGDIKSLVEQRVFADWLNDAVLRQPSIDMIQHAMEQSGYDENDGKVIIENLLDTQEQLEEDLAAKFPSLEEFTAGVEVCFHYCKFDEQATVAMMSDQASVSTIVDLARRGCHFQGRALVKPTPEAKLERISTAMKASAGQSLSGMVQLLQHSSQAVASNLSAARGYMLERGDTGAAFDPRFLIFEYMVGFMLRRRQVELVNGFVENAANGKSRVEQMIMGQGKTTVIGPILALILGNGTRLVTQVCPDALLDMTRDVMRSCFSSVVTKRVYTLSFDRSSASSNDMKQFKRLLKKLEVARAQGSIVVTTPGAVKSLMLKYVDLLQSVQAAPALLRCPLDKLGNQKDKAQALGDELSENAEKADVLAKIIKLWGKDENGVALLDEVDLLLHPLKSELNYPIGPKQPLESHEFRWDLPIFLLDALLYPMSKKISLDDFRPSADAVRILRDISHVVDAGVKSMAIQPSPHLSLLRKEFYDEQLKTPMAEWAMLWLLDQPAIIAAEARMVERSRLSHAEPVTLSKALTGDDVRALMLAYIQADEDHNAEAEAALSQWLEPTEGGVAMKMLNLGRDWICSFVPHCFAKVDRIGFGLLHQEDLDIWEEMEGTAVVMPASRKLLAVPFVALEVPSRSSEFAHPEVLIGLTVLAYRYEGLREEDMKKIVRALRDDMNSQAGPFSERAARVLFSEWIDDAKLMRARNAEDDAPDEEIMPLELFQVDDEKQMGALLRTLSTYGPCIVYYLQKMVFSAVMKKQAIKLQASGVDLGGDMLFGTRLGFSGTPSDLLPDSLKPCHYEPGSEAEIVRVLTSPEFVTSEEFKPDVENPRDATAVLLKHIATARQDNGKGYHALIDTGALITGFSNEDVARELLRFGLANLDACVFLDPSDRKMVVDRTGGKPVPLNRCGFKKERRFVFYDQVHTTGMDIKHTLDARAMVTLGKDMTLRDFAQGCYRMRGLGKGQTLHLLIGTDVLEMVHKVSSTDNMPTDVMAWLLSQSMHSEKLQYMMLAKQRLTDVWRTSAFRDLLSSTAPGSRGDSFTVGGTPLDYKMAAFGPKTSVHGAVELAQPELGDGDLTNAEQLAGRFAVMRRGGGVNFVTKVERAQAAGAIGVIIINSNQDGDQRNNAGDEIFNMGGGGPDDFTNIKIPSLMIKFSDEPLVLGKKGLTASLSITSGTGCPLQTRFYGEVPEAEIDAVLTESSLYTEEELAEQEKKKLEEGVVDEIKAVLRQLSTVMDAQMIRELHSGLQSQPPEEQLAALKSFAEAQNIDLKAAEDTKKVASAEDKVLKKAIAAALIRMNDTMGDEMVQTIHQSIQRMPLKEQLEALSSISPIPLELPSARAEPYMEPEPELAEPEAEDLADPVPEPEPEQEPEPEPEPEPEGEGFSVSMEIAGDDDVVVDRKEASITLHTTDTIASVQAKARTAANLSEDVTVTLINKSSGAILTESNDEVAFTVADYNITASHRLQLLVHGESLPFELDRASSADGESLRRAFTTSVVAASSPEVVEQKELPAGPWLVTCIDLFREPLELTLADHVPEVISYSETLGKAVIERGDILDSDTDAADAAAKIVDELREGERKLEALQAGATKASASSATNLDSEVVQEQEQEQEQKQEVKTQKQQRTDYARNPKEIDPWPVKRLFAAPSDLVGPNFFRVADFRVTPESSSLQYPKELLVSNNFAPQLHRADEARRLKNVEVVLRWEATVQGISQVFCVVVSLAEAETLRRQVQHWTSDMTGADMSLCSSAGLWLTAKPAGEGDAIERPMTAIREGKATEEFHRMRTAGDDVTVAKTKALEAADTAVRTQLHVLFQQHFADLTASGLDPNTAAVQAVSMAEQEIDTCTTGALPSPFPALRHCARFFNNEMWFNEEEVILLLQSLSSSAESERRLGFEDVSGCRKRDRVEWSGTAVEKVFSHSDEHHLRKMRELSLRVRSAISASGKTMMAVFEEWDEDNDGWLSQIEMEKGLIKLQLMLSSEDVVELLKHADQNNDSLLNYREFAAEFSLRGANQLSRAERTIKNRKSLPAAAQRGSGIVGLQGVVEGMDRTVSLASTMSATLTSAGEPSGQFDWRRLASLGQYFISSGGQAQFHGDGRVTTVPGYRPSVSPRGVALTQGKWFYEVVVVTRGRGCVGFADYEYSGDASAARGVGDDAHSWGYDGYEGVTRHSNQGSSWGREWQAGDVIGCFVDLDDGKIQFSLNGTFDDGMGTAFSAIADKFVNCMTPVISFDTSFQFLANFGDKPFRHQPLPGFRSVQHWVREFAELKHVQSNRARFGKVQATSGSENVELEVEPSGAILMQAVRTSGSGSNFPSATVAGCLLTQGKWYYEFTVVENSMAIQIGWADLDFVGSQRDGHGVGDDKHSWGYDGCRAPAQGLWWDGFHTYGRTWSSGDTIGCEMDLDEGRMSFSINGQWMPTVPQLENLDYVVGLTPGFTMQAPTTIRINLGAKKFKYSPRAGAQPVQAWLTDRENRILKGAEPKELAESLEEALNLVAIQEAADDGSEDPMELNHQRLLIDSQRREVELRMQPSLAAAWQTSSGGLARTQTFVNAPPPSGERTAVPLRVSSGFSKAVVSTADGTVHSTGNFPSVVGDIVLRSGKWVYEVQVLEMDPVLSVPSAIVGWADSKRFFGDYAHDMGVGDDKFSWGIGVQRSRGLVRHDGSSQTFEPSSSSMARTTTTAPPFKLRQGSSFGVALDLDHRDGPQILFGTGGSWHRAPPEFSAKLSAESIARGLMPAVSCRSDCQLQINFGASPFSNGVPEGFLPVHCSLTGDLSPGWLTETTVAEASEELVTAPSAGSTGDADLAAAIAASMDTGAPAPAAVPAAGGALAGGRAQTVTLLMSQLRITCELVKLETAKMDDGSLDALVDKLEKDMKLVTQRLAALTEAGVQEGVPPL